MEDDFPISGLLFHRKYIGNFSSKLLKILEILDTTFDTEEIKFEKNNKSLGKT